MNLLSVAAAYGVVVAVFQWGWGESLFDFNSNGGVAAWLPMFLFVILFGLSMDYHVFILSRVREYYDRGLDTEHAVAKGIKSTAGVVTSAAVVMVLVFGVFALMPLLDMKEMGIGLAAAILIDATIVRAVLLPATMKLLGKWNWYLPSLARVAPQPRAREVFRARAAAGVARQSEAPRSPVGGRGAFAFTRRAGAARAALASPDRAGRRGARRLPRLLVIAVLLRLELREEEPRRELSHLLARDVRGSPRRRTRRTPARSSCSRRQAARAGRRRARRSGRRADRSRAPPRTPSNTTYPRTPRPATKLASASTSSSLVRERRRRAAGCAVEEVEGRIGHR